MRSNSTFFSITPATSPCIPSSRSISVPIARRCLPCGERTIHFSCLPARRHFGATSRMRKSTYTIRATSRSKPTATKSGPLLRISSIASWPDNQPSFTQHQKKPWRIPMRAIVIQNYGGPEQLVIQQLPDPEPQPGSVVIEVKAFGINHAEMHMRRGEWAEAAKVSGIECVGLVRACPDGQFSEGEKVAALMGGMGRTINGSYAEYTRVPAANVVRIESGLAWEQLAAIPESYATAWTCLHRNLELRAGQTLVIRGATSALGQSALNIAAQ